MSSRKREQADDRLKLAEALRDLGRLLVADLPLPVLLTDAIKIVRDALGADRAAAFIGPPIRPVALLGVSHEYVEEVLVDYRRGPGGIAEAQRTPLFIPDVLDPKEPTGWIVEAARREGFRGLVLAPFVFAGRVNGAFSLYYDEPTDCSAAERALVESLADQLALAVESARREALALAERRLCDQILEELPIGVLVSRPGDELEFANRLARVFLAESQITRATHNGVAPVVDKAGREFEFEANPLRRGLAGQHVDSTELSIRAPPGRVKTYLISSRPFEGRSVTAFQDITGLREVEVYKNAVIAIAAHELRSPVTALRLSADALRRRLDEHEHPAIDLARKLELQVDRLADLVEHFLTAATLASEPEVLALSRVDLLELVESAAAQVNAKRGRDSALTIHGETEQIWGDRARLFQAVGELIDNAIVHGGGAVEVELSSAGGNAVIRVLDHGQGVPPERIADLFERFTLARAALPAGGLGLGLYVAAAIARRHGGELGYEPRAGGGACFTLTLPLAGPAARAKTPTPPERRSLP